MDFAGAQILSAEEEADVLDKKIFYDNVPRDKKAEKEDQRLDWVREWHRTLQKPEIFSNSEYESFMHYTMGFVLDKWRLWRKHSQGAHQLVIPRERRLNILREVHDNIGHK